MYIRYVCVCACVHEWEQLSGIYWKQEETVYTIIYNSDVPCSSRTIVTAVPEHTTGAVYHLLIIRRILYRKLAGVFSLPLSRLLLCFLFCFHRRPFFFLPSPALHVSFCSFSCNPSPLSPSVSFGTNEDIKISNGRREEETWERNYSLHFKGERRWKNT